MASDEETRLMSRMLTRGATMLGEHCDGCGNPLFRVEGEVVCAVCSARDDVDADGEERDAVDSEGEEDEESGGFDASSSVEAEADAVDARDDVRRNLSEVVHRLSEDAGEERDLSRLNRQLDALQKAVDLLERL